MTSEEEGGFETEMFEPKRCLSLHFCNSDCELIFKLFFNLFSFSLFLFQTKKTFLFLSFWLHNVKTENDLF